MEVECQFRRFFYTHDLFWRRVSGDNQTQREMASELFTLPLRPFLFFVSLLLGLYIRIPVHSRFILETGKWWQSDEEPWVVHTTTRDHFLFFFTPMFKRVSYIFPGWGVLQVMAWARCLCFIQGLTWPSRHRFLLFERRRIFFFV